MAPRARTRVPTRSRYGTQFGSGLLLGPNSRVGKRVALPHTSARDWFRSCCNTRRSREARFERVIAKFGLWQDSCVFLAVAAIRESLAAAKYDCQSRLPFVRPAHVGTRRFVHPMQVRERAAGGGFARACTRGSELRERLPGLAGAGSTGAVCSALVCRISRVTHARERPRTRCSPRPGASWRPARRPAQSGLSRQRATISPEGEP
jgi:hypothetical protein